MFALVLKEEVCKIETMMMILRAIVVMMITIVMVMMMIIGRCYLLNIGYAGRYITP